MAQEYDYFTVEHAGDVAVLKMVVKELRHPQSAQEFGAEVRSAVQALGVRKVVIDMGAAEYLGSTAFATLLNLVKAVGESGGVLKLCNLHPEVQVGANILGLGHALEIHGDKSAALNSF